MSPGDLSPQSNQCENLMKKQPVWQTHGRKASSWLLLDLTDFTQGVSESVSLGTSLGVWHTCDGPVFSSHQRRGWYWVSVDFYESGLAIGTGVKLNFSTGHGGTHS